MPGELPCYTDFRSLNLQKSSIRIFVHASHYYKLNDELTAYKKDLQA
jgi:hypothetical protein